MEIYGHGGQDVHLHGALFYFCKHVTNGYQGLMHERLARTRGRGVQGFRNPSPANSCTCGWLFCPGEAVNYCFSTPPPTHTHTHLYLKARPRCRWLYLKRPFNTPLPHYLIIRPSWCWIKFVDLSGHNGKDKANEVWPPMTFTLAKVTQTGIA